MHKTFLMFATHFLALKFNKGNNWWAFYVKQEPKVDLQACGLPDFFSWDFKVGY